MGRNDIFSRIDESVYTGPSSDYLQELNEEFEEVLLLYLTSIEPSDDCGEIVNCYTCTHFKGCINDIILKRLREYIDKYGRIPYATISQKIYTMEDSEFDLFNNRAHALVNNLKYRCDIADITPDEQEQIQKDLKICLKICDHIQLATRQNDLIREKENIIKDMNEVFETAISDKVDKAMESIVAIDTFAKELKGNITEAQSAISQTDNKIQETDDKYNRVLQQLISIVAIFTGLAFVGFGGISSLSTVFTHLTDVPLFQAITLGSLSGLVIMNMLFFFLYFVSKMTGMSISMAGNNDSMLIKYPLFFITNVVFVCIFIVSFTIFFVYKYNDPQIYPYFILIIDMKWWIIGLTILICFGFVAYVLVKCHNWKKENI